MGANPQYAEGDVIANKYVVDSLLGESPSGCIYLATGNFNSQKICVKLYRNEVSSRFLAAPDFFLKAAAMTEIEHDNLISTLDVQEELGLIFVARGFTEGQSFEEWLKKSRSEANYFPRGLEFLWQISQGLTALHERTRHLNIHPGNLIVGSSVAKLCDWDPRSLSNMEMTPEALPIKPEYRGYRAPESSGSGSFLSYPSTDLFSVGALLYRLVKGEHPATNPSQTQQEIRGFDQDIAAFLSKALHPRPEERFQEAGAFSDALWELKPAMVRMQERNKHSAPARVPEPAPKKQAPAIPKQADPFFPEFDSSPSSMDSLSGKEPTLMGLAKAPSAAEDDSFFNFFPPADASPPALKPQVVVRPPEPKSSGDTLFGTPDLPSYQPPAPTNPRPQKSGLESLESSGTLFGSQAPPKQKSKPEHFKPEPVKPLPISLSSLEKDPLDMAGGNATGGFTQFGFKGAGENRTGIFTPENKAAAAKRKLMLTLAGVGGLILVLALIGLFLYLRGTAAPKEVESPLTSPIQNTEETAPALQEPLPADAPDPVPAPTATRPTPPAPEEKHESVPVKTPEPAPTPATKGNSRITPEREALLMIMIQNRTWPASASERLRAADDFNDLGKTAEANMAYGKTLAAGDITEKQKVSALGGMAVTFKLMGMDDQAKDAVQRILEINPKNGFALKLQAQLK
jgi:serine/threonine protein kinase